MTAPLSPETAAAIRREVDATLAKRSISGVFAYVLLLAIFFVATPALSVHPTAAVAEIAWMSVLAIVRLWVARSFATSYSQQPARWSSMFRSATLVAGLSWGVGCALWTHVMGHGPGTMIMLVSTAGVAAGAMSSLGPSARLAHAYIVCIIGPTMVTLAITGEQSRVTFGFVAILAMYAAFLMLESKRVHDAFVLAVRRTFLLGQRADELAERTRQMKLVLDTVGQGFIGVTPDGRMANERSAILERWLGSCRDDEPVWSYLERTDPDAAIWLQMGLESLSANLLPHELVIAQLPRHVRAGDRHIEIEYRPSIVDDRVATLLMILSDTTSDVEHRRSEREQRELMRIFENVAADRRALVDFVADADKLVGEIANNHTASDAEVLRWIHTLKGNSLLMGLEGLGATCHDTETAAAAAGEPVTAAQRSALADAWISTSRRIASVLGTGERSLVVTRTEYEDLVQATDRGAPHTQLAQRLRQWDLEPSELRLARIAEQARGLARRLGKGEIDVVVEANGLRLPPDRLGGFWSAFVHVVRNAVDHGLEPPDDRISLGKPACGTLRLRTFVDASELVVSLEDDGRGIDWERVAASARRHGLPHATRADLEAALFADGVSTAAATTEISGRGVGMAAVRYEVEDLGGRLCLSSQPTRGTCWTVRLPRTVLSAATLPASA